MLSSLRTSQRFVHRRHDLPRSIRTYAKTSKGPQPLRLHVPAERRENEIGVQQLPQHMRDQLFKTAPPVAPKALLDLAKQHLTLHELYGKTSDNSAPIAFDLPPLQGKTLDEHFYRLGREASEPFLSKAQAFAKITLLPPPGDGDWVERSGWTKYTNQNDFAGVPGWVNEAVEDPGTEDMLVFDVEVLYKESPFAIMACAASPTAWYGWLSPWLLEVPRNVEVPEEIAASESEVPGESGVSVEGDVEKLQKETEMQKEAEMQKETEMKKEVKVKKEIGQLEKPGRHLIPLGDPSRHRVVVGHNIGYDRARIKEEYSIKQTKNYFMDTMSLHVAVNGMCSRQRPTWMKHAKNKKLREKLATETESPELESMLQHLQMTEEEEELWIGRSSINSLRDVAKFHCDVEVDKSVRDQFGILDRAGVMDNLQSLLSYCAADVAISHEVYKATLPRFLSVCEHPVSFAALRHLSAVTLPVNKGWETYIKKAEETYQELLLGIATSLNQLAENAALHTKEPEIYLNDEWLRQLDWSGTEIRYLKTIKKGETEPRMAKGQNHPGKPKWYKNLFPKANEPMNLSVRSRVAPLLLRMTWLGQPLIWSDLHGWTVRIVEGTNKEIEGSSLVKVSMQDEKNYELRDDTGHVYYKLPHKDGPTARCTSPLAKSYLQHFESGTLASSYILAKEALKMNAQCSYWISARERIRTQMVIYEGDTDLGLKSSGDEPELGIILPQIIPMGTITRRAVERTWLTASNAKKNRVGSELKAMVTAPPGYALVGADVDSEELWIASLVGDAQFKLHGGGALGFMTLEGAKAAGTDLHSKTAKILSISRNNAKIFNYGRIYGAGLKFASTLLRQFNPSISEEEAISTAQKLYDETKGTKVTRKTISQRPFWRGGTESMVFNKLEEFAEQDTPRTPVLGAGITEALQRRYISRGGFLPSRINWAIQSSGVDYLHLLIISMDYLIRRYGLDARLAITVHDEIRYLVKEEDKYKLAMSLQVANVWTRSMFSQQMGIEDLPQSCAWFSAVDIDSVLRKEVDLDCITPSHPNPIPPGESIDIEQLLAIGEKATLNANDGTLIDLSSFEYTPRVPVMETLGGGSENYEKGLLFLKAQIARDDVELREVVQEVRELAEEQAYELEQKNKMLLEGKPKKPKASKKRSPAAAKNGVKAIRLQLPSMDEHSILNPSSVFSNMAEIYPKTSELSEIGLESDIKKFKQARFKPAAVEKMEKPKVLVRK